MPNPYLPFWEYIPDGEPRVFGDRVYVYGSHDEAGSDHFCDYVLKCWSAPVNNLNVWISAVYEAYLIAFCTLCSEAYGDAFGHKLTSR